MKSGDLAREIEKAFGGVDARSFSQETFETMLGLAGIEGSKLPERMAEINEVLNALPPPLREKLLVEFLNGLYRNPATR